MRIAIAGTKLAVFALLANGGAVSAQQSLRDFEAVGQSDVRATASITIPLGGPRDASTETAPRLDFSLVNRRYQVDDVPSELLLDNRRAPGFFERRTALSFTIEQNPQLFLNGRRVATFGPTLTAQEDQGDESDGGGLSTGAGIAIGAGVILGLSVILATTLEDEIENLGRDD